MGQKKDPTAPPLGFQPDRLRPASRRPQETTTLPGLSFLHHPLSELKVDELPAAHPQEGDRQEPQRISGVAQERGDRLDQVHPLPRPRIAKPFQTGKDTRSRKGEEGGKLAREHTHRQFDIDEHVPDQHKGLSTALRPEKHPGQGHKVEGDEHLHLRLEPALHSNPTPPSVSHRHCVLANQVKNAVQPALKDEGPRRSVPQTAQQEHQHDVQCPSTRSRPVAAKGDVHIIPEPRC